MGLKGDLKSISLANVLQDLAQNEQTGTLALTASDRRIHFWFEKGQLRLVGLGPGRGPSLLNGLLATGKLRLSELGSNARLDAEAALTRSLLKRNSINKEDSRAALHQQMFELVCDAFLWSDASFEFTQGEPADELFDVDQLDHEVRLAGDPIIMEALRRIDEWPIIKKTVLSPQEILVAEAVKPAGDLDPITARILSCLDGQRRLKDVIEMTHLGTFNVFKAASTLKQSGFARTLSTKEALDRARLHAAKGQWEPALRMARFALEGEPSNIAMRQLAGEALEKLERRDEAAAEYRLLANAQAETGDKNAAINTCRRILTLAPRDTFTQERLFQLLVEAGHKENALSQGEALASAYKRAGLPDKAIDVYMRLMSALGDSDDLLEATAEIARHLGDKKEAIQIYRRLFDRALARGDEEVALQLSRTLLRLDPGLEDIAQRRVDLETGAYRKRIAFRRRVKLLIASLVVLALGGIAGVYEWRARGEHGALRSESMGLLASRDYRKLLDRYDALLGRYPGALTCRTARDERTAIEDLHATSQLEAASSFEGAGHLIEAIAAAETVRDCSINPANRDRAEGVLVALRKKKNDEENRWLETALGYARDAKTDASALAKLEAIDQPLAVPALDVCLKNAEAAVRKATIGALRKINDDGALELLVRAFAADTDGDLRADARSALVERTNQNFTTPLQWQEWLLRRASERSPFRVPPLQAALVAETTTGQPVVVRWELRNVGGATLEFTLPADFGPAFEGLGAKGHAVVAKGESRLVRLRSGEFLGGRIEITGLEPGTYHLAWSGTLRWNGAAAAPIKSLPLVIDVK